jgi:hypothetical protein
MRPLERTPSRDQVHNQNDDRDDEQEMDQRATEVTDEAEKPENQKHNKNSPEHMFSFGLVYFTSFIGLAARLRILQIPELSAAFSASSCEIE